VRATRVVTPSAQAALDSQRCLTLGPRSSSSAPSAILDGVSLVELSPEIARLAGLLDTPTLRSLDAIHVASALSLGADVGPFLTYDARMQEGATAASLDVRAPA
jgi:uncharacterized protein